MYRLGRRPGLDGVRALAITVVFLSHVQWHVPGGYYGVDVFFVLSGFLITTLLIAEHGRNGTHRARARSTLRRARRLFPALVCALVLVAVIFTALVQRAAVAERVRRASCYVGNWFQALGHRLAGGLLVQTWSAGHRGAVLLPVADRAPAWASSAAGRAGRSCSIALIPAIGSYTLRTLLWQPGAARADRMNAFAYFSSFTRADSILLGCALAIAIADDQATRTARGSSSDRRLAGAALAVIVGATLTDRYANPLVWAVVIMSSAVARRAHRARRVEPGDPRCSARNRSSGSARARTGSTSTTTRSSSGVLATCRMDEQRARARPGRVLHGARRCSSPPSRIGSSRCRSSDELRLRLLRVVRRVAARPEARS